MAKTTVLKVKYELVVHEVPLIPEVASISSEVLGIALGKRGMLHNALLEALFSTWAYVPRDVTPAEHFETFSKTFSSRALQFKEGDTHLRFRIDVSRSDDFYFEVSFPVSGEGPILLIKRANT